jgi:hypothetical protein
MCSVVRRRLLSQESLLSTLISFHNLSIPQHCFTKVLQACPTMSYIHWVLLGLILFFIYLNFFDSTGVWTQGHFTSPFF